MATTTIGTRLFTLLCGAPVGRDEAGNRYYREKRRPAGRRERRWVVYEGEVEASRVPPEWHRWLHHVSDAPPTEAPLEARAWEKPHRPNATGTAAAYRPPGHILSGGRRDRATGDYEPWHPDEGAPRKPRA